MPSSDKRQNLDKGTSRPIKDFFNFWAVSQSSPCGICSAFQRGTNGARRHFWSRGLKAKVGLADKTDEELAVEAAEKAIEAARLDREAFVSIRQWEDGAGRGQVLTAAEAGWNMGGADGLCQAIAAWLGARGLAGRVWSGVANRPDLQ